MTAVDRSSYLVSEYRVLENMARSLWKNDDAAECRKRRERIGELVNERLGHHGHHRAAEWLQAALGATVCGIVGPRTRAALLEAGPSERERVYREVLRRRMTHCGRILSATPVHARFAHGWMRRPAQFVVLTAWMAVTLPVRAADTGTSLFCVRSDRQVVCWAGHDVVLSGWLDTKGRAVLRGALGEWTGRMGPDAHTTWLRSGDRRLWCWSDAERIRWVCR